MTKSPYIDHPYNTHGNVRIPPNSWDRAPWNRWAFQHIRELLPTTEVQRGSGPVWQLPYNLQPIHSIKFVDHHKQSINVDHWLGNSQTDGFILLHNGRILFERYYNGMHERQPHLSQSVAKSVTSSVLGVLVQRGQLDTQATVTDYLPELANTGWRGATLRHCLDMSSGVHFNEDYEAIDSDIAMTDFASGWKVPPAGVPPAGRVAPASIKQQILALTETVRPHGSEFQYRSIETDVLAMCAERACNTPFAELVSREIWTPLGTENCAYFTVDPAGFALADGGFNACLRDYARFGQMLANQGIANGVQVVPWSWIADLISGKGLPLGENYRQVFPRGAYRSKFWLPDKDAPIIMALGVFGQWIYVDLQHNIVCVKLSSWPESVSNDKKLDCMAAIGAISSRILD